MNPVFVAPASFAAVVVFRVRISVARVDARTMTLAQRVNPEPPSLPYLLTEARTYWREARDRGDILAEDQWLGAIDFLLDREDMPRG